MATLLERTREINHLLQEFEEIEYPTVAKVLSNVIGANVYIADVNGEILGYAFLNDFECDLMLDKVVGQGRFPRNYSERLLTFNETSANRRSRSGRCAFADNTECMFKNKITTIVPIYGVRQRIGTLLVSKYDGECSDDDILLAEYGAAVIGLEMLHNQNNTQKSRQEDDDAVIRTLKSMSFHEQLAVVAIVKQLEARDLFRFSIFFDDDSVILHRLKDDDGVVATEIFLMWNITRSVIVNSIRMMQVAKIVSSKSMGMKGTRLTITNNKLPVMIDEFIKGNLRLSEGSDNDDISITWNGLVISQQKKLDTYWDTIMTEDERITLSGVLSRLDDLAGDDDELVIPWSFPISLDEFRDMLGRMGNDMKRTPFVKTKNKGGDEVHVKLLNLFMMDKVRAFKK